MQRVNVAAFNDEAPAIELKERLEDNGIRAFVHDERKLQRYWFLTHKPYAAVQLQVLKEDGEIALNAMEEWHARDGVLKDAIMCPSCGSLRVEYPQMTRKFVLPTLVAHLLHLIGLLEHQCYCEDCQNTWRPGPKVGWRDLRAHLKTPCSAAAVDFGGGLGGEAARIPAAGFDGRVNTGIRQKTRRPQGLP